MTGILSNQLPGRANPPDADNPLGSFKDRTAPGANDGSYLTQTWSNDRDSILQALFIASGLTPNGIEDTGTASQLFDALVNNRWSSIGNYLPGTIVTASDGNQYYCISPNGRDATVVDPTLVFDRSVWVKYPYQDGSNSNGKYRIHFDGTIEQWGITNPTVGGRVTVILPIEMPDSTYNIQLTDLTNSTSGDQAVARVGYEGDTKSTTSFVARLVNDVSEDSADFYVRG